MWTFLLFNKIQFNQSILNGTNTITIGKPHRYDKLTTISIAQLQTVNKQLKHCQILTVSPSRQSAQNLHRRTCVIGKQSHIITELCIGGTTLSQDIQHLSDTLQIMNGVMGRIYELIKHNAFSVKHLRLFILDSADMLLDKGFKEQIDEIITCLPQNVQIAIFCSSECF